MNRLSLKIVGSFLGNCLIITDNQTNNNIEVMVKQLQGISRSGESTGTLPHANWYKEEEIITIYHDDGDNHKVSFTLEELSKLI